MTAETDLLPCPFCGSENIDPKGWASTDSAGPACDDCGACAGGVRGTLQDNIAAWNRRAQAAEIKALRAEVERVNSWNASVSVCRDHVTDIVDGPCVICALDAAEARAERLAEALHRLEEACDDSDGAQYGTLGTSFVRGICKDALLRDQEEGK